MQAPVLPTLLHGGGPRAATALLHAQRRPSMRDPQRAQRAHAHLLAEPLDDAIQSDLLQAGVQATDTEALVVLCVLLGQVLGAACRDICG